MLIDWPRLVIALLLLLTPVGVFHGARVRYRAVMRDWDGYWLRTLSLWLHGFDVLRAAAGAWLLMDALQQAPAAHDTMRYGAIAARAVVLGVATIIQAVVCKEPEAAHAPFAFVGGLVVGILPPLVAAFALVLGIALALGGNAPTAFFPILALSIGATGALFTGKKIVFNLITVGIAVALPWLVTLLFPRHFVCSYRAKPKTAPLPPPR